MSYIASSTLAALDGSYTDRSGCPKAFQQLYIARDFFFIIIIPPDAGILSFHSPLFQNKKDKHPVLYLLFGEKYKMRLLAKKKRKKEGDKIDI